MFAAGLLNIYGSGRNYYDSNNHIIKIEKECLIIFILPRAVQFFIYLFSASVHSPKAFKQTQTNNNNTFHRICTYSSISRGRTAAPIAVHAEVCMFLIVCWWRFVINFIKHFFLFEQPSFFLPASSSVHYNELQASERRYVSKLFLMDIGLVSIWMYKCSLSVN